MISNSFSKIGKALAERGEAGSPHLYRDLRKRMVSMARQRAATASGAEIAALSIQEYRQ